MSDDDDDDFDVEYGPHEEPIFPLDTRTSQLLRVIREQRDNFWRPDFGKFFWRTDGAYFDGRFGSVEWNSVDYRNWKLMVILSCREIPETVWSQECLQSSLLVLIIWRCSTFLFRLPSSLGALAALCILEIDRCNRLGTLPDSIGGLKALHTLRISNCSMLTNLSNSLGKLTALCHLHIQECPLLTTLPESVYCLTALRVLSGVFCPAFGCLPESIGHLQALQILNIQCPISEIPSLGGTVRFRLPDSLGRLGALEALHISDLHFICPEAEIPESIGNLSRLKVLEISSRRLTRLPDSIGRLSALCVLNLKCDRVEVLPDTLCQLDRLEVFFLSPLSHALHHVPPFVKHGPADVLLWFGRRYAPPKLLLLVLAARTLHANHLSDECWVQLLD